MWFIIGLIVGFAAGFVVSYWIFKSRTIKHIKRDLMYEFNKKSEEVRRAAKGVIDKF